MSETVARMDAQQWGQAKADTARQEPLALDAFLRDIERRALRMAELSTGQRDEALDLVQDAMFAFARNYASKPAAEWGALFHRVLDNRITDWHRRQQVRGRWLSHWFSGSRQDDDDDPIAEAPDLHEPGPLSRLLGENATRSLDAALRALPLRQRQAFLLRIWEGLDVADTAIAMRCSAGSVKTHLWRAMNTLRTALEEHQ
ncbi:MAG: RNA polymerase sigma factor [Tahibacter sp.]